MLEHLRDDGHWTDEWASRQAAAGPVGATAAAAIALIDSGVSPSAPEVSRAVDWLWGRTVAPAAKDPDPPEAESLAALAAFLRAGRVADDGTSTVVTDSVQALREIQNDDGGWAMAHNTGQVGDLSDAESTGEVLTVRVCPASPRPTPCETPSGSSNANRNWTAAGQPSPPPPRCWVDCGRSEDGRWLPVRQAAEVKRTQPAGGGWRAGEPDATETARRFGRCWRRAPGPAPEVEAGIAWLAVNLPSGAALAPLICAGRDGPPPAARLPVSGGGDESAQLLRGFGVAVVVAAYLPGAPPRTPADVTFAWPHLFQDSGSNYLIADALRHGLVLYRDVTYPYGPLPISI